MDMKEIERGILEVGSKIYVWRMDFVIVLRTELFLLLLQHSDHTIVTLGSLMQTYACQKGDHENLMQPQRTQVR